MPQFSVLQRLPGLLLSLVALLGLEMLLTD